MLLTADQILGAKLATETITVKGLGTIRLQEMTGEQRAELDLFYMDQSDEKKRYKLAKAKIAALSIVDDKGKRLFDDSKVVELAKLPSSILNKIDVVATELNKATEGDIKKQAKK